MTAEADASAEKRTQPHRQGWMPEGAEMVEIASVVSNPNSARAHFDITSLRAQIQINGITKPILVHLAGTDEDGKPRYRVVDGERRLRAAQAEDFHSVPISVVSEQSELSYLEHKLYNDRGNKKLSLIEEAEGIMRVLELRLKLPPEEIKTLVSRIGRPDRDVGNNAIPEPIKTGIEKVLSGANRTVQDFRVNILPFLNHPLDVREAFKRGLIGRCHARLLGNIQNEQQRAHLMNQTMNHGMTVHQLRNQISSDGNDELLAEIEELANLRQATELAFLKLKETPLWGDPEFMADLQKQLDDLIAYGQSE